MLIQFRFENHLSFLEEQCFSMEASALKEEVRCDLVTTPNQKKRLIPFGIVYGANASGKSNFIGALHSFIGMIMHSHGSSSSDEPIRFFDPYRLTQDHLNQVTSFEASFIADEVEYTYGFEFDRTRVVSEWLYSAPKGVSRLLFERNFDDYKFGKSFRGKNVTISELTKSNSLFISTAVNLDHDELVKLRRYFGKYLFERSLSSSWMAAQQSIAAMDWTLDTRTLNFLQEIGTGVLGYEIRDRVVSDEELEFENRLHSGLKDIFSPVMKDVENRLEFKSNDFNKKDVYFLHRGVDNREYALPIQKESAGTLRFLASLPKILRVLAEGSVCIIDEIDLSLHTTACEKLFELFASKVTNPRGAQLIATTHDTNILNSSNLRRDQVWFSEKSEWGSTRVYPLTDFSTKQTDNLRRRYLDGRYGALPEVLG